MWLISSISQLAPSPSREQHRRFSVFIPEVPLSGAPDSELQAASLQLLQVFVEQAPAEAAAIMLRNPLASPRPAALLPIFDPVSQSPEP